MKLESFCSNIQSESWIVKLILIKFQFLLYSNHDLLYVVVFWLYWALLKVVVTVWTVLQTHHTYINIHNTFIKMDKFLNYVMGIMGLLLLQMEEVKGGTNTETGGLRPQWIVLAVFLPIYILCLFNLCTQLLWTLYG